MNDLELHNNFNFKFNVDYYNYNAAIYSRLVKVYAGAGHNKCEIIVKINDDFFAADNVPCIYFE